VGLAGTRRPLEQQTAPGRATHLFGEGLVRQEQVQRPDDVVLHGVDAHDIVEAGRDLVGPVDHVRRAPGHELLADDHADHQGEEAEHDGQERVDVRQRQEVLRAVPGGGPPRQHRGDAQHGHGELQPPARTPLLAGPTDVGVAHPQQPAGRRPEQIAERLPRGGAGQVGHSNSRGPGRGARSPAVPILALPHAA